MIGLNSHLYKGVWRSVESEFLRWKVALQALTMMSATRWQLIANEINLDCNCTKIETIITRHRNKILNKIINHQEAILAGQRNIIEVSRKLRLLNEVFAQQSLHWKWHVQDSSLGYQLLLCYLGDVWEVDQGYQLADEELVWCSDGRWTPLFSE